jgi:lipopolysaccharide biosynthesis regulator YciM
MSEFDKVLEDIKQREIEMGIQIATLQADRDNIQAELRDCVNELCLQCGQYRTEHLGSCDSCRWKKVKEGLR